MPARRLRPVGHTLVPVVLLVAAGLAAYSNSFRGVFVFDDLTGIVRNPAIRTLWPLTTAIDAPRDTTLAGRPVASLSFALTYAAAPPGAREAFVAEPRSGLQAEHGFLQNVRTYHIVNLAIHVSAALCLFGVMRWTLLSPALSKWFTANPTAVALAVSGVWVVHPLTTGAVTYIVQRVESLMGFFYLLTLYASIRAHRSSRPGSWTALAAVACLLGMGTKESMASAPLVVIAWDWLFVERPFRQVAERRWRLYALLAATWIPLARIIAAAPRAASVGTGVHGVTPWQYLATQAEVLLHYLRLVFVPWPLVLDYEWPIASSVSEVAFALAVVTALLVVTVWGLVRRRTWAMAGVLFFAVLAPTSSVVPIVTEVAAEHRMYLPLAGVIALVTTTAVVWWNRFAGRHHSLGSWGQRLAWPTVVAAAVALGILTHARNLDYASEERMYLDTVRKRPENSRARNNLATVWLAMNRPADAEAQLREAVRLKADYPEALTNLGVALAVQGRPAEGLPFMAQAVDVEPSYADGWRNYAEALASTGRFAEAIPAYEKALAGHPDDARLLTSLAWTLATAPQDDLRDGRKAMDIAERAVELTARADADALDAFSAALAELGRYSEAVRVADEAVSVARRTDRVDLVRELQARTQAYRAGRPVRQGPAR